MFVALTGGIGAGKSTVARLFASHGARVVDADAVARQIVDPSEPTAHALLSELRELLGDGVFTPAGGLDRPAVAARVFTDPDLLGAYNALLRPALLAAVSQAITTALADGAGLPVVHEIPLLNSRTSPLPWAYDTVITVEASLDERLHRLCRDRGYTPDDARTRIVAQGTEATRVAIANTVIRNDGTPAQLEARVDELWLSWISG